MKENAKNLIDIDFDYYKNKIKKYGPKKLYEHLFDLGIYTSKYKAFHKYILTDALDMNGVFRDFKVLTYVLDHVKISYKKLVKGKHNYEDIDSGHNKQLLQMISDRVLSIEKKVYEKDTNKMRLDKIKKYYFYLHNIFSYPGNNEDDLLGFIYIYSRFDKSFYPSGSTLKLKHELFYHCLVSEYKIAWLITMLYYTETCTRFLNGLSRNSDLYTIDHRKMDSTSEEVKLIKGITKCIENIGHYLNNIFDLNLSHHEKEHIISYFEEGRELLYDARLIYNQMFKMEFEANQEYKVDKKVFCNFFFDGKFEPDDPFKIAFRLNVDIENLELVYNNLSDYSKRLSEEYDDILSKNKGINVAYKMLTFAAMMKMMIYGKSNTNKT